MTAKTNTLRKILVIVILSAALLIQTAGATAVHVTHRSNDVCGFAYYTGSLQYAHMGRKTTDYTYVGTANTYAARVQAGIAKWGSKISVTQSISSGNKINRNIDANLSVYALAEPLSLNSNGETLVWQITIYDSLFPTVSTAQQDAIMAHEFGHVFGLGHIYDSSKLMYPNAPLSATSPTASDNMGMDVVTHTHNHGSLSSGYTMGAIDNTYHARRCSTCKTDNYNTIEPHAFVNNICTVCGARKL